MCGRFGNYVNILKTFHLTCSLFLAALCLCSLQHVLSPAVEEGFLLRWNTLCLRHLGLSGLGSMGLADPMVYGILIPQPEIEPESPALEGGILNHWTTKEVPTFALILSSPSSQCFIY